MLMKYKLFIITMNQINNMLLQSFKWVSNENLLFILYFRKNPYPYLNNQKVFLFQKFIKDFCDAYVHLYFH